MMATNKLREIALRLERALGALPQDMPLRTADGKLLVAIPSPTATETGEGVVTVSDVYEMASAVLYLKLSIERKSRDA